MGYEVTRFAGEIDQEFVCPICKLVLEDAMQSPCDHLFCKECIMPWLAAGRNCPVDRRRLEDADLKPVARFFRNVLGNLMIKCDFEQQGCDKVVQLGQLQSHRLECTRNPNAEVVCDKGCNMTMRRHDYEMNDCLTHLSSRLAEKDLEITGFIALANCLQDKLNRQGKKYKQIKVDNCRLQEENQNINGELNRQQKKYKQIKVDNRELNRQRKESKQINDAYHRLQEENQHIYGELNRQREENRQINDAYRRLQLEIDHAPLNWHRHENVTFTGDFNDILEVGNKSLAGFGNPTGCARLFYSLKSNFFFGVQILDWNSDSRMVIGLTLKDDLIVGTFGGFDVKIRYNSYGNIQIHSKEKAVGTRWKNGDTIHCGIKISENPDNKGENFNVVVFLQNGKSIGEKRIEMPSDGLYPTIYMWNCKVRYSTQSNLN